MTRSVLVLNSGSSSVKYAVLEPDSGALVAEGIVERIGENCEPALTTVLFMAGAGGSLRAGPLMTACGQAC